MYHSLQRTSALPGIKEDAPLTLYIPGSSSAGPLQQTAWSLVAMSCLAMWRHQQEGGSGSELRNKFTCICMISKGDACGADTTRTRTTSHLIRWLLHLMSTWGVLVLFYYCSYASSFPWLVWTDTTGSYQEVIIIAQHSCSLQPQSFSSNIAHMQPKC